jgi:hypothetical protein
LNIQLTDNVVALVEGEGLGVGLLGRQVLDVAVKVAPDDKTSTDLRLRTSIE